MLCILLLPGFLKVYLSFPNLREDIWYRDQCLSPCCPGPVPFDRAYDTSACTFSLQDSLSWAVQHCQCLNVDHLYISEWFLWVREWEKGMDLLWFQQWVCCCSALVEKNPVENKFKSQFIAVVGLFLLNSVPSYCCPYSASSCLLQGVPLCALVASTVHHWLNTGITTAWKGCSRQSRESLFCCRLLLFPSSAEHVVVVVSRCVWDYSIFSAAFVQNVLADINAK